MARWQAELVAGMMRGRGATVEVVELSTCGDRDQGRAIGDLPSDAPFADDIERALLCGEIDVAVHCLKDLPTLPTPGLTLAAVLPRHDVREALVSRECLTLAELRAGSVVGTSSARRAAQLRHLRPELRVRAIRGPVEDRVRQVRAGRFDAAVLALAGLERLGLAHEACEVFDVDVFMPAPGQGALVVQVREGDARPMSLVSSLDHEPTRRAAEAEWALQAAFDGDDSVATAAHADCCAGVVELHGRLLTLDGSRCWDARAMADNSATAAAEVCVALEAARACQSRDRKEAVLTHTGGTRSGFDVLTF